jgi:hypothetical protein
MGPDWWTMVSVSISTALAATFLYRLTRRPQAPGVVAGHALMALAMAGMAGWGTLVSPLAGAAAFTALGLFGLAQALQRAPHRAEGAVELCLGSAVMVVMYLRHDAVHLSGPTGHHHMQGMSPSVELLPLLVALVCAASFAVHVGRCLGGGSTRPLDDGPSAEGRGVGERADLAGRAVMSALMAAMVVTAG